MTTNHAGAANMTARTAAAFASAARSLATWAAVAMLGVALAGCETASNILGSSEGNGPQTALTAPPPAQTGAARIAVAPVIGAPDTVAKQMQSGLGSALQKASVSVAQNATDKADYTLRGYVVSAREKTGVKVSYIWDVTDPAGQRVKRITGEEMVAAAQGRDPWAAVSPQVIETISSKTAGQVAAWLPSAARGGASAATVPVASAASAARAASVANAAAAAPAGPTTGSIGREGAVSAFVPNVSGAPGDGRISLTSAIQRELSRNGVALANATGASAYRVEGVVKVGEAKEGKQPIAIDWHVKDPSGKAIGTVSQKNDIQAGSLDGSWGPTADAAAAAASQGIIKLLPKQQ